MGLRALDSFPTRRSSDLVADGGRADAGDVGAGVGLGDAEAADPLALDGGDEVGLLLLLGAELQDRRRRHVGVHRDPHAQTADRKSTRLNSSHPSISYAVF